MTTTPETLDDHLWRMVDDAGPWRTDLDTLAAYIATRLDAALEWPESPLGALLETIDGPVLERAVLAVLEQVAERGPGAARTLYSSLRYRLQVWAEKHPERVERRRQRRQERRAARGPRPARVRRFDRLRGLLRPAARA